MGSYAQVPREERICQFDTSKYVRYGPLNLYVHTFSPLSLVDGIMSGPALSLCDGHVTCVSPYTCLE